MEINYRNYTNGSAWMRRGYRPGDVLIAGWADQLEVADPTDAAAIAEHLFMRHNRDDRPDGQMCPSMSVGDVVVIGEIALTVEAVGFSDCSVDPDDIVTGIGWVEWIDTANALAIRAR